MTATAGSLRAAPPTLGGLPGKLEVAYRYQAARHLRLLAGSMPQVRPAAADGVRPAGGSRPPGRDHPADGAKVRAAARLCGSDQRLHRKQARSASRSPGSSSRRTRHPTFWSADPVLAAPSLDKLDTGLLWDGGVIADPGELAAVQQIFGEQGLSIQWVLPVDTAALHGQAPALLSQLSQITGQTPGLTGHLAPMADALTVSSGLVTPLTAVVQASNAVNVLLWMVYVSLAVAGVVVLLLAARMITARRLRGADPAPGARGIAVAAVLGRFPRRGRGLRACHGAGLGACRAPDPGLGPARPGRLVAGHRDARHRRNGTRDRGGLAAPPAAAPAVRRPRRRGHWVARVIVEVTACAAAVGGIIVFRGQPGATDFYTSAAPVLVAVPAVIVALRLYQVLLRSLARASARQRGLMWLLGLARAARASATLALPAMTLVLALTVAAFTGMVRDAVLRGETAASWQATGADVVVAAPGGRNRHGDQPRRRAGDRRGARRPACHRGPGHSPWTIDGGQPVPLIAVDPASYAALVASTQGFSPVDPALLTAPPRPGCHPGARVPAGAAALGGQGGSTFSIPRSGGLPALRVRGRRRAPVHPGAARRRAVRRGAAVGDPRCQPGAPGQPDAADRAVHRHGPAARRGARHHAGNRYPGHHHAFPGAPGADRGTAAAGHVRAVHPG